MGHCEFYTNGNIMFYTSDPQSPTHEGFQFSLRAFSGMFFRQCHFAARMAAAKDLVETK